MEIQEIEYQVQKAWPKKCSVAVEVRNPTKKPGQEMLIAFVAFEDATGSGEDENPPINDAETLILATVASDSEFRDATKSVREQISDILPSYMVP